MRAKPRLGAGYVDEADKLASKERLKPEMSVWPTQGAPSRGLGAKVSAGNVGQLVV